MCVPRLSFGRLRLRRPSYDGHIATVRSVVQPLRTRIEPLSARSWLPIVTVARGAFPAPVVLRTHGGRARALDAGELVVDVAFVAAPAADELGNVSGRLGRGSGFRCVVGWRVGAAGGQ